MAGVYAVVDWTAAGSLAAVAVTLLGTYLVYRRGRHSDTALSLSQSADRRSKETETVLQTQGSIIDQLQEEVKRYQDELRTKAATLDERDRQLEEARHNLRELRQDLGEARSGLAAAQVIIDALEREVDTLRRVTRDLEASVSEHERRINNLLAERKKES